MIEVSKINVYYPQEKEPSPQAQLVECHTGRMPGTSMKNEKIESHSERQGLLPGQGLMCIRVMPGEKLGEVFVNIQYEGPVDTGHGEPNLCMSGQNNTLLKVSDFLQQLFGQAEGKWDVVIDSEPCPKANVPPLLDEARLRMEGKLQTRDTVIEHKRKLKREG
jgi:hypothetical protein